MLQINAKLKREKIGDLRVGCGEGEGHFGVVSSRGKNASSSRHHAGEGLSKKIDTLFKKESGPDSNSDALTSLTANSPVPWSEVSKP